MFLYLFPSLRAEKDQHGQDLQSAEDHRKDEDEFGKNIVSYVGGIRTDRFKGGTDVGNAGKNSGKITEKAMLHRVSARIGDDRCHRSVDGVKGKKKDRRDQKEEIERDESKNVVDGLFLQRFSFKFRFGNVAGIDQSADVIAGTFDGNDDAGDLDAACGGARHRTREHQNDERRGGDCGPDVIVRRGEACGGDKRCHLEKGMAEGFLCGVVLGEGFKPAHEAEEYEGHSCRDDQKIAPELLAAQNCADLADEDEIIKAEIAAEKQKEDRHRILRKGVEERHALGNETEAACACTAEGGEQTEKELIVFISRNGLIAHQNNDLEHGHAKVDHIKDARGRFHFGNKLADLRPRAFRTEQMHGRAIVAFGNKNENENKDAHAADPMGKASPEEGGARDQRDIRDDAGTCGGEAGGDLKKSVDEIWDIAVYDEGERTEKRHDDPHDRCQCEALFLIQRISFRLQQLGGKTEKDEPRARNGKRQHVT